MRRLDQLAHCLTECDVVALTGDCTSTTSDQLPEYWDDWPQPLKLSVPGNHDFSNTFDTLLNWCHRAPWVSRVNDLVLVGIDSADGFDDISSQLSQLATSELAAGSAVVLLSHQWPGSWNDDMIVDSLIKLTNGRPLLVLHGHEHPISFNGSLWDDSANLGSLKCYRSKVTCCSRPLRGHAHFIRWENGAFDYSVVRGNDPRYEPPGFGAA